MKAYKCDICDKFIDSRGTLKIYDSGLRKPETSSIESGFKISIDDLYLSTYVGQLPPRTTIENGGYTRYKADICQECLISCLKHTLAYT